jgi:hypothetical protein
LGQKKNNRVPYDKRSDLEKIRSQWIKLTGLHNRKEASAAIVRAATAAEIAANYAIRCEFARQSQIKPLIVDDFLIWANGLDGKINRLVLPLCFGGTKTAEFKKLQVSASQISEVRNKIVHRGVFASPSNARKIISHAGIFVQILVRRYDASFKLTPVRSRR